MELQKHTSLLILIYALCFLSCSKFGCGSIVGGYWNRSCVESEKKALLLLKRNQVAIFSHLSSWVGDDCCAWHGIGCDNRTGHVTQLDLPDSNLRGDQINPFLLDLKYLTDLDLSSNNFDGIQIPEFFGSFKNLRYLNLSGSNFKGLVPHHLGNLSNLRYLDLNDNYLLNIDSMEWLSSLSLLKHLDLSFTNLSRASDWFPSINMLPNSVLVLKLYSCDLPGNIPHHLPFFNVTSLVSLDLGDNQLNSSFPIWIFDISDLEHLTLAHNGFYGTVPKSIGRLTSLLELDLSYNNFSGPVPKSIESLTFLSSLDLSSNKFQGSILESTGRLTSLTYLHLHDNIFDGFIPESIGSLPFLTDLDISHNSFTGLIPQSIGNLTSLSTLTLSYNKLNYSVPPEIGKLIELTQISLGSNEFSGCLPTTICQLSKLEILSVPDNQLSGNIPSCIGELSNLYDLDLISNLWEGFVSEHHFINLTRLTDLHISSNSNLVWNISSTWVPPFQLEQIHMESMNVGPKYPQWLLDQRQIQILLMKNTSISDTIPADWFVNVLLSFPASVVDLSNNDINVEQMSLLPAAPNYLQILGLSSNRLSGEFPAYLCNLTNLRYLVLSNNNFSGALPQCLGNLTQLRTLDVMNNSLSGEIPVSLGFVGYLTYLNLHNNKFHGKLPRSFQNLTDLVLLDVGKNNLTDIVPSWAGEQLSHLRYLILRSNNFYGKIPSVLCYHSSIQVLNLARNQISGNIPPCLGNLSAMITGGRNDSNLGFASQNGEMIIDDAKGYELRYTSTLEFLFSIDLSNNNISGEITDELMALNGLMNLNLAGNHLAGRIPKRIGELKKLEFLDLSRNELKGPIPQSISDLNFLSHLNLSFNDLSGRIPSGSQIQTLDDPSIYAGNNQLCGRLILKPCAGDEDSHNVQSYSEADSDSNSDNASMWFYAGIGPGLLVGFLGFCGSLHFIKSWRHSYFYFVEQIFDRIVLVVALLWRKFHK